MYNAKKSEPNFEAVISRTRRACERVERCWIDGKMHLKGPQVALVRVQKKWEEDNFMSRYLDTRNHFIASARLVGRNQ